MGEGGTVLLDEIGEMAQCCKRNCCAFLQEREFERVGGNASDQIEHTADRGYQSRFAG